MSAPDLSNWLDFEPYCYDSDQKSIALTKALTELTVWHRSQCSEYQSILDSLRVDPFNIQNIEEIPFIPVRLFREFELLSIERKDVFKTMTSSGTSGQQVSKIYLNRETASLQTKILSRLMKDMLGKKRVPMLVIDSPDVLKNRQAFSARGAGILGFSMFGQDVTYALDESMALDIEAVQSFIKRHSGSPIFVFGFTFMVWQYFVLPLRDRKIKLSLEQAVLLHGGGWKKLQDEAVDNTTFRASLKSLAGIDNVVNYYGMVEQTGSLFMECEFGHLHAPVYADVIVRRLPDFEVADLGEKGILQVLSMLPLSYPGHSLLTEDTGTLMGEDDCSCGRLGKYFQVHGRLAKAEVRGCSDTHEKPE